MSLSGKKRRHPTGSSPNVSDDDNTEPSSSSASQVGNKRRSSFAADFASHRLIVSERQQMAVLKQLTAGDESNVGSQSPSSNVPQMRPTKIHRRNEHGETIVHIAARRGDIKQLKKVLKAGGNVNEADNAGWTPLHEAVTKNQFKAARLLLKSGANVNAPGPEGQTPLVDAVLNNNTKMAELLLSYAADPSVVDFSHLNETMLKVLKRELSVLDSSENENNDDESNSSLSSLTSDEGTHDEERFEDKQISNFDQHESNEKNLTSIPHKKAYRRFRDHSSQSSDSSTNKNRTTSGNNEGTFSISISNKNPYDFESEEEGEIRENPPEIQEELFYGKKKLTRKQRTQSGGSSHSTETTISKRRSNRFDQFKEQEQQKSKIALDDEQVQQIHRIPPLKIVLARAVLQRTPELESSMTSNIDENSSSNTDQSALSIAMPTNESDEKVVSSYITNPTPDVDNKVVNPDEEQTQHSHSVELNETTTNNVRPLTKTNDQNINDNDSELSQKTVISILQSIISEIERNVENSSNLSTLVEDEAMDVDEEGEEEVEDEEEDAETTVTNNQSTKSTKNDRERNLTTTINTRISSKHNSKPTTRTLRSHARGKYSTSAVVQSPSSNVNNTNGRRVSNRRRALEAKSLIMSSDKERKRRIDRSRRDKDNSSANNEDLLTSSNSDDQNTENSNQLDKLNNPNDDASSCSSQGAGEGSSTSSSTIITKQSTTDLENLPPNKRRLKDRTTVIISTTNETTNSGQSTSETTPTDVSPAREIPINNIKQYLEIRQQIGKRRQTMLNEFVVPKVPQDFSETTMAKKNYLIASNSTRPSNNSSSTINIKRLNPPSDLDQHLLEVFIKQEDERYRMKLRHQVERDKLILSHEQEVLRLYGNATRSSLNQEVPFSFCALLKDEEVYNNPSIPLPEREKNTLLNSDYNGNELGKRGKHRWNGRSLLKWLEDSNLKYKRLSMDLNERQRLEAETLYSMQRMVWSKHLPKDSLNSSLSGRSSYLLNERYLPKVEINPNFWTHWEPSPLLI